MSGTGNRFLLPTPNPFPRQWELALPDIVKRAQSDVTQVQMAAEMGVSQPIVSQYERGHRPVYTDKARKRYRKALDKLLSEREAA